jgi:hypothetical protein
MLEKRVVMRKNIDEFDHFAFQVGKDMSYTKDVLKELSKYHSVDEHLTIY